MGFLHSLADTTNATIRGGIHSYRSTILALQRYEEFSKPPNISVKIFHALVLQVYKMYIAGEKS